MLQKFLESSLGAVLFLAAATVLMRLATQLNGLFDAILTVREEIVFLQ